MNKKHILYISYDGLFEPLGLSQILPTIVDLSINYKIHLFTFEKKFFYKENINKDILFLLKKNKISWYKLNYSNNYFFKIIKFLFAFIKIARILLINKISLIHIRSYIPGLILFPLIVLFNFNLIFDIRGFWPEEKIDRHNWSKNNIKYKLFKKLELFLFNYSKFIICLTKESKKIIIKNFSINENKISVIPTCADQNKFFPLKNNSLKKNKKIIIGYFGSTKSAYGFSKVLDLIYDLSKFIVDLQFKIYTHDDKNYILNLIKKYKSLNHLIDIKSLKSSEVNKAINNIHLSIFYLNENYSVKASYPTKIAELLSCGKPIICNNFNKDIYEHITINKIGLIHDFKNKSYNELINYILEVKNNQIITYNCINYANKYLNLDFSNKQFNNVYKSILK